MKAVSAVILTDALLPGEIAASGIILGATLLILGATGSISRFARLIPQSVALGLQLGLALLMAILGFKLMLQTPWISVFSLILLVLLSAHPALPGAPVTLLAAICAVSLGEASLPATPTFAWPRRNSSCRAGRRFAQHRNRRPAATLADPDQCRHRDGHPVALLFPVLGAAASERQLALSSGLANVLLCPFGAMPMCHAPAACRRSIASAPAPASRRSSSVRPCWSSRSASPTAPPRCSRSFPPARSGAVDLRRHRSRRLSPPVRCPAVVLARDRRGNSGDGSRQSRSRAAGRVGSGAGAGRHYAPLPLRVFGVRRNPALPRILDGARRLRGKCGKPVASGGN